jgi:pyridoxine kinase
MAMLRRTGRGDYKGRSLCGKLTPRMNVLSIQSSVVYGHVGNAAATLPLQRMGFEVWPVNTVTLSNHPAHGGFRGRSAEAEELRTLIQGIGERGAFARCDAVLSGYLGEAANGPVVLEAVAAVKRANPGALYCCDPVMGEKDRGVYVRAGIPAFFRDHALAAADIVIPNLFELEFLSGRAAEDIPSARAAAQALLARGPRLVIVSGLRGGNGSIAVLAATKENAWLAETPTLDVAAHGAGDAFAAMFLGHYLKRPNVSTALGRAISAQYALMQTTARAKSKGDLALIAAQDTILAPKTLFKAKRLR